MKLFEKFDRRLREFHGKAVGFRIDQVRIPNGKRAIREYLNHPGAVAVVPLVDRNHVVMVRQFRYAVGAVTWEIPAGKLDPGESPLSCLKRELEEETGYRAKKFKKILSFWPTASFANEIIHVYSAHDLQPGLARPDVDEFLECKVRPVKRVLQEIKQGRIKDAKTIIGLLAILSLK